MNYCGSYLGLRATSIEHDVRESQSCCGLCGVCYMVRVVSSGCSVLEKMMGRRRSSMRYSYVRVVLVHLFRVMSLRVVSVHCFLGVSSRLLLVVSIVVTFVLYSCFLCVGCFMCRCI